MSELRVEVVRDFSDIEAAWRLASEQLVSYVFQSYEWLALWHATAGTAERTEPIFVRVSDLAGRAVLLLPLGMKRIFGCRILVSLGGRVSDYNAPVIDRMFAETCSASDFAELWRLIVRSLPPADLVWLERMPQAVESAPNPMVTLRYAVRTGTAYAASPLPASFKAYTDARNSNVFRDAARKRRRIEAIGPVSFEVMEAPEDIRDTVALALAQKFRRHSETGQIGLDARHESFYERFAVTRLAAGRPHVSRLRIGNTIVATHLGAVHGSRFYWLLPGYEGGEWARYSVGRLLQQEIVKWCIAEGLETFDMTGGDEAYKRFWADTQLPLFACRYGLSPIGTIIIALVRSVDIATQRAKKNVRVHALLRSIKLRLSDLRRTRSRVRL